MINYPIWPWSPERKLTETLEWATDILEAYDGSEQRVQLRIAPRQSFAVTVASQVPEETSAMNLGVSWGQSEQVWGWGLWQELSTLEESIPVGAGSISHPTCAGQYFDDGVILLWESPSKYEALELTTVTLDTLNLLEVTTQAFAAGSFIMPLRTTKLTASVDRNDYNSLLENISLMVKCVDPVYLTGVETPQQYLSADVYRENFLIPASSTLQRNITRSMEEFDPGMGDWQQVARSNYPLITTQHYWRFESAEEIWAFRLWLHRRQGRINPVWMPSRRDDFILAEPAGELSTFLTVKDINYSIMGVDQPTKQHIAIFQCDGTFVCRQILSAVKDIGGVEILELDTIVGFSEVSRISFLSLHRLVSDRVEIAWERPGVAEVRLSMVGVEQ